MRKINLLTLEEVADILRLKNTNGVTRLIRDGVLPATHPNNRWLVRESDLEALLDAYTGVGPGMPGRETA